MADYGTIPPGASLKISPFKAEISEEKLQFFKQLIHACPIGPEIYENEGQDRTYGMRHQWLTNAKEVWDTKFDWRETEKRINSFPNFTVKLKDQAGDEVDFHFAALFSKKPDAIPISMAHGWPGSFLEFLKILDILKKRYTPEDLPYHVIVPSLPGYGFSSVPKKDFDVPNVASLFDSLMKGLGFNSYVAHGGDVGSGITMVQSLISDACKGYHLNNIFGNGPPNADQLPLDDIEKAARKRDEDWKVMGSAYAFEHGTRPGTIGLALQSSPIALLAWIGEKYLEWTDEDPPLEDILEVASLYWLTETIGTSLYPYRAAVKLFTSQDVPAQSPFGRKPMGYSYFPNDIMPMPVSWVQALTNCTSYKRHDSGGHFAGLEKPVELLEDIEAFIKTVEL